MSYTVYSIARHTLSPYRPAKQTYFFSKYSSVPYRDPCIHDTYFFTQAYNQTTDISEFAVLRYRTSYRVHVFHR